MSQPEKAALFNALKTAGVTFEKHYREYKTDELRAAYEKLGDNAPPLEAKEPKPEPVPTGMLCLICHQTDHTSEQHAALDAQLAREQAAQQAPLDPAAAKFFGFDVPTAAAPKPVQGNPLPVRPADPNELAGQRLNTKEHDEPLRVDPETGRIWYQEEVRKPAYPKPRGRRKLTYMDPGVERKVVKAGDYTEEFEIAGDPANAREAEVKITLPSYQVGIYKDKRFPFKVVIYNDDEGFDLDDVNNFYGGAELVPAEVKRKYVSNTLCYDIRTTVRAIEAEYRAMQLRQQHQPVAR